MPKKKNEDKLAKKQEEFKNIDIDQVLDEIDTTLGEKAASSFGPAYKEALKDLMERKYEFATQRGTWERVTETLGLLSLEIGAAVQGTLTYLRKKITGK